jgi:predicted nucleotidyltransferase
MCITGSHLYGYATENSDVDYRGLVRASITDVIGRNSFEQYEDPHQDIVIYSELKFFKLLERGSPNVLELLCVSEDKIIETYDNYEFFRRNIDKFITNKTIEPTLKFAISCHQKVLYPQKAEKKRKELVTLHGYDTKSATNAIRLLNQYLNYKLGKFNIYPFDSDSLSLFNRIRSGNMLLNEYLKEYESTLDYVNKVPSLLPERTEPKIFDQMYLKLALNPVIEYLEREKCST